MPGVGSADPAPPGGLLAPPTDTGEARGLAASRLTLTIGFGPSLFDGRFGLRAAAPGCPRRPAEVPRRHARPARCGGDIAIQACADDPQVAVHAIRNLCRIAHGTAAVRWAQLGFGKASSTDTSSPTPRNLFGFKDGTANILGTDEEALAQVRVGRDGHDDAARLDGRRVLSRRASHPDDHRDLGPHVARRAADRSSAAPRRSVHPWARRRERATVVPTELPETVARARWPTPR